MSDRPEFAAAKPPARWFRFSLRAALIALTVAGGILGWITAEYRLAAKRKAMLEWVERVAEDPFECLANQIFMVQIGESAVEPKLRISWMRRLLGDQPVPEFQIEGRIDRDAAGTRFAPRLDARRAAEISELFPEAHWMHGDLELVRPDPKMTQWPSAGSTLAPGFAIKQLP